MSFLLFFFLIAEKHTTIGIFNYWIKISFERHANLPFSLINLLDFFQKNLQGFYLHDHRAYGKSKKVIRGWLIQFILMNSNVRMRDSEFRVIIWAETHYTITNIMRKSSYFAFLNLRNDIKKSISCDESFCLF